MRRSAPAPASRPNLQSDRIDGVDSRLPAEVVRREQVNLGVADAGLRDADESLPVPDSVRGASWPELPPPGSQRASTVLSQETSPRRDGRFTWSGETSQTLQEDAIREACGEDAQRLDREMRAERRQWQGHWNVLVWHDTLLHEEKREREDQRQREQLAARSSPTRSRDRGEPGWTR